MIFDFLKKIKKKFLIFLFILTSIFSLNAQLSTEEVLRENGYRVKSYINYGLETNVYKVKKGRKKFAALVFKDRGGIGSESFDRVADFLEQFKTSDSNILRIVDSFVSNFKYIIITELADNDLSGFLEENLNPSFSVIMNILIDIAQGLDVLHSSYLVHCDLKSKNILIFDKKIKWFKGFRVFKKFPLTAKITDPSFVKQDGSLINTREGTYSYMAPEYLEFCLSKKGFFKVTRKLDIYAFGLIGYELFSNKPLFLQICEDHLRDDFEFDFERRDVEGNLDSDVDIDEYIKESRKNIRKYIRILKNNRIINSYIDELNCSYEIKELIKRCLDTDAENRPDISEILDIFSRV